MPIRLIHALASVVLPFCLVLTPCLSKAQSVAAPEAASGRSDRAAAHAAHQMIATANPLASAAGLEMLRRGGSALDAAIAAQMVLTLVEPQSSGIGGGALLVYWSAPAKTLTTFDGRETAPSAASPDRFLDADGKARPFNEVVAGGRSVGVPGVLRALELAHKKYGRLPWHDLFQPAINLAEHGFIISPRLHMLADGDRLLRQNKAARDYFFSDQGTAKPAGERLINPALAVTLRLIADHGADMFYSGAIAEDIVGAVTGSAVNPGDMRLSDLATYRAKEREAVCGPYRIYRICGMGPPSSGPITLLQALGMLESKRLPNTKPLTPEAVHLIAEADKIAFADRNLYLADVDFVPAPVKGLLDRNYLASRAKLIDPMHSLGTVAAGVPPKAKGASLGIDDAIELPSTSHIAIVDASGNALSMTTTVEAQFGARLMVRGFLLNNQLTDFSFTPMQDGKPVANRVEPGKRPRSSMSPLIVFDAAKQPVLIAGSAGGSAIINYVMKIVIGVLDWGLDPQAAIALPNFGNRGGATELEAGTKAELLKEPLERLGHKVSVTELTSGSQAILINRTGLIGGVDPRREGLALGD